MPAHFILAVIGCAFLIAGAVRRISGDRGPQSRAWLLVGTIFAAVSTWLFFRT